MKPNEAMYHETHMFLLKHIFFLNRVAFFVGINFDIVI